MKLEINVKKKKNKNVGLKLIPTKTLKKFG